MNAAAPQPLKKITDLAKRVCERLWPWCLQVEIAGSIRRGRPMPADIDLVLVVKPGEWGEFQRAVWQCAEGGVMKTDGTKSKRLLLRKSLVQCDLWIADLGVKGKGDLFNPEPDVPGNFGALMLTYTGSVAHNIKVVETAKEKGWRWHPNRGLVVPAADDDVPPEIVSVSEREIFMRLFGEYIEPADREIRQKEAKGAKEFEQEAAEGAEIL